MLNKKNNSSSISMIREEINLLKIINSKLKNDKNYPIVLEDLILGYIMLNLGKSLDKTENF